VLENKQPQQKPKFMFSWNWLAECNF